MFCLATNQIAQTGLSSLPPVIYYSEQLFRIDQILEDKAQKLLTRIVLQCTCNGVIENCSRCGGRGEYVVDGNGNRYVGKRYV
ncbi:hypothetical protein DN613_23420 [Aeromonas caviae]|nr:hypothetical protein DN613_23420 [Aeromonas caviae]